MPKIVFTNHHFIEDMSKFLNDFELLRENLMKKRDRIEERLKKEPDLLMAIFEEGNELDRFLIQEGHEPKFSAYIALALEKASIDAYNKKSISIGRLNDIRWNLLNLAPISGKI